ncbi:MazG-like family protein [Haloimpatiens lingqiaonensis]|uniref:MazG-like family protein n=1 Tax=Haloimpatiens lingqiaonensis TaxID=1380675 RepID=UPI0010FF2926|nr:MazG-like family protein [Haloimpatiens lingqiaonensis]
MKKGDFNIMSNIKIIESLKADLLCVIGQFFKLLTKGSNVAQNAILNCISGAIILLYVIGDRLGYSFITIDEEIKDKLKLGIIEEDEVEKDGKDLSRLYSHLKKRE